MTELPDPPTNIARLPRDHRGYPVPWFVEWIDGKPDFRIMNGDRFRQALQLGLCWFRVRADGPVKAGVLVDIGTPTAVEWWAEGRTATRAEVLASVLAGLPTLTDLAEAEGPDAVQSLEAKTTELGRLLPVE